ncbi:putative late blight resistance proteinR1B-16 [Abeliophyllum distichum]|uniref:Late blight resistance proteinR1B-16 n=1 Tax=Abeliophyllum distichum TaxID=126358 RepID=A0ABD1S0V0_9LAMI
MEVEDETDEEDLQAKTSLRARSSKFTPKDQINSMGFDDDLMEIKSRLIKESSELDLISIVGMGRLEHWRVCPILQRLALGDCEYLEEISSRNGEIPTLVPIKLYDFRNSLV